ncbi:MAG: RDD family protein [Sulfurovum sp.]|nr:RDD family protein [Sulfurovum sp.]MDD3602684.1 RDD family protein [Sulfurovum sp.]
MAKNRFRKVKQGVKMPHNTDTPPVRAYAKSTVKIKAFLTDSFILLMPIMYVVFYLIMDGREDFAAHKLAGWIYILAPLIIIQTLFMIKTGQTPGYRAYGLKIIDESTGEKPAAGMILFRNVCAVLSFFSLFGWIMMFFRKDYKTLHDLLSHTAVIYTE